MFVFGAKFITDVKAFFGSDLSPRLEEALAEGEYDFVERFLGNSRTQPTWEMVRRENFLQLKTQADREIRLQSLYTRCLAQKSIHDNQRIAA